MSRGRKKVPTAELERRGSVKARYRQDEPEVQNPGTFARPENFTDMERQVFDYYADLIGRMKTGGEPDSMALELLVRNYCEYENVVRMLAEYGLTFVDDDGNVKLRPEARYKNQLWDQIKSMLVQFGLTPASRPNLRVIEKQKQQPVKLGKLT